MSTDSTRAQLLDATEALLAEGGEAAASLRAITRRADANVAAIHYHFGGRDGLIEAVLDRYVGPLNARRLDLLEAVPAEAPLEDVLDAFLRPDLELIARLRQNGRELFARSLGAEYTAPSPLVERFLARQFEPIAAQFIPRLASLLPDLDQQQLSVRMSLLVSVVTGLFAGAPDAQALGPLGTDDLDEQTQRLVAFAAGGLCAPVPTSPSSQRTMIEGSAS